MAEKVVMKQGEKYESSNEKKKEQKKVPGKAHGGGKPPKIPVKLLAIVLGIVVVIIIGWFVYNKFFSENAKPEATPEDIEALDQLTEEETLFSFVYSEEDWTTLKAAGYTDSEIVEHELAETSVESLLESAAENNKEEVREMYQELKKEAMTTGSPEYKNLMNNTWLGLTPFELAGAKDGVYDEYVLTENVSYSKVGTRGAQCFIKLNSFEFGTLFHQVTANRYMELRDTGNLVITYQVTNVNGSLVVNNISEEIVDQIPEIEVGGE